MHAVLDGARHRAVFGVEAMHAFRRSLLVSFSPEVVADVNASDHHHVTVLLNLAHCVRRQPAFTCRNPARLQRATQGARQSTCGGSNQVVDGRGVGFVDRQIDAILLRDL